MGELAVHLVRDGAFLQHHDQHAGLFGERRDMHVDDALAAVLRRAEVDAIFVDRRIALARLFEQRDHGRSERHEFADVVAAQHVGARLEEGFRRDVDVDDPAALADAQHRMRQRVQHSLGRAGAGAGLVLRRNAHAAARHWRSSSARSKATIAASGVEAVMVAALFGGRNRPTRRFGRGVEIPAEMLSGVADADLAAVKGHETLVMFERERPLSFD